MLLIKFSDRINNSVMFVAQFVAFKETRSVWFYDKDLMKTFLQDKYFHASFEVI